MDLSPERRPDPERLNAIALCAGYGGLELGLGLAEPEYRTVCFVEREAAAAAALVARMEDAALHHAPVWDDVKSFDGRPWRGRVDLVTGGYPCQPFSVAGQKRGDRDPRHLWPDIARIIEEVAPRWCFFENVEGHLNLGLPDVAGSLQSLGYRVKAGLFSAAETGASHWRHRVFLLAHADRFDVRQQGGDGPDSERLCVQDAAARRIKEQSGQRDRSPAGLDAALALDARGAAGDAGPALFYPPGPADLRGWREWLAAFERHEPAIPRDPDGLAERVERSRAAGNGVCPLAAALAWRTLKADFEADLAG